MDKVGGIFTIDLQVDKVLCYFAEEWGKTID